MTNNDIFPIEQTGKTSSLFLNKKLFLHKLILNKFPDISIDCSTAPIFNDNENVRQSKYDNVDCCRHSDTTYSDCTRYSDPWHWEPPYHSSYNLSKQNEKTQKTATINRHRNRENQNILSKYEIRNHFISMVS